MKRMLVTLVLVVGMAGLSLGKAAPSALSVWVLTLVEGGQSAVGDSYTTREQAVAAAQAIESDSVWVTVDQSQLNIPSPRKGFPAWWDKLSRVASPVTLHAQSIQELAPASALVLPTTLRDGEFISPTVSPGAARRARASIDIPAINLLSPLNAVTVTIETTGGQFVCGASLLGPAPISSVTGQPVAPFAVCNVNQAVQARVYTCHGSFPRPICTALPQTLGVTIDLISQ